jgi:hypothetical protein
MLPAGVDVVADDACRLCYHPSATSGDFAPSDADILQAMEIFCILTFSYIGVLNVAMLLYIFNPQWIYSAMML